MNPYESPANVHAADSATGKSPPDIVRWAVGALALSYGAGFCKIIYLRFHLDHPTNLPGFIAGFLMIVGLCYLILRGLYRGKKWAHVLLLLFAVATMASGAAILRQVARFPTQWEKILFVGQTVLQATAAVLLVLPAAWKWFYRRPVPAPMDSPGLWQRPGS